MYIFNDSEVTMPDNCFIRVENVNNHPWNLYRKNRGDRAFIAECLDLIIIGNVPTYIVIESTDIANLREKMLKIL
jgi:hypothetical protein